MNAWTLLSLLLNIGRVSWTLFGPVLREEGHECCSLPRNIIHSLSFIMSIQHAIMSPAIKQSTGVTKTIVNCRDVSSNSASSRCTTTHKVGIIASRGDMGGLGSEEVNRTTFTSQLHQGWRLDWVCAVRGWADLSRDCFEIHALI